MKQPSIFLSHTSIDKYFARRLGDELSRAGAKVWIDIAEIKLGDSLIRKISDGIECCDYLGVILSPDSVESEWVKREVEIAMSIEIAGKRVVVLPLLLRECKIPAFLTAKLYADFTTSDKFIPSLNLIKSRLGLSITPATMPNDEVTESILARMQYPIGRSVEVLEQMVRSNKKEYLPITKVNPIIYVLKNLELELGNVLVQMKTEFPKIE